MYDKEDIIKSLEDTIKMIEKMSSEEFIQKMKDIERNMGNIKDIDSLSGLKFVSNPFKPFENSPCENCPNNIKNGGSGICHCILGNQTMT